MQQIKSRIWGMTGGKSAKTLAKIQVSAVFNRQGIWRNDLHKFKELWMEMPCWCPSWWTPTIPQNKSLFQPTRQLLGCHVNDQLLEKKKLTVPFRHLFPTRVFNTGIIFHFSRHQFLLLVTIPVQWQTNQNHDNGIFSVSDTGYSGVEPMNSWLLVHILYHWATTDSWQLGLN